MSPGLSSVMLALLVCHGGPGVPSDYVFPLVEILQRSVIFLDQLGCGRSDRPDPTEQEYSIAASVRELVAVIGALVAEAWIPIRDGRPAYHLYGQSFGGILDFETLTVAGSHWRGVDVIADSCVHEGSQASFTTPVLRLAAEHDFVTPRSMQGWQQLAHQHLVVLPGVAHHALLETPVAYGAHLELFLQNHEDGVVRSRARSIHCGDPDRSRTVKSGHETTLRRETL